MQQQFFQQGVPVIPGLPHRPPESTIPPVISQMRDSMKGRLPSVVGYTLINVLESGMPTANPARQSFYARIMANNLNNQEYPSIVLFISDYAEALCGYQQAASLDAAIEMAAKRVAAMMSARIAQGDAAMINSMSDQVRQNTFQWVQEFTNAGAMIKAYQAKFPDSTSPQIPQQQNNMQMPNGMVAPQGFMGGFGNGQPQVTPGNLTTHLAVNAGMGDSPGVNWQTSGSGNSSGPVMRGGFVATPAPVEEKREVNMIAPDVSPDAQLIEEIVFSYKSPIKPRFDIAAPYAVLYDPRKNVVLYKIEHLEGTDLKTGSVLKYILGQKEENVKYEDHETESFFAPLDKFAAAKKPQDEKTAADLRRLIALEEVDVLLEQYRKEQGEVVLDSIVANSAVHIKAMMTSLMAATPRMMYQEHLNSEEYEALLRDTKAPVMFSYRIIDTEPLSDDACLVLEGMFNAPNLRELIPRIEQLGKLYAEDKISDNQWTLIMRRLTDNINEVLRIRLHIPVDIDSAAEDIGDLLAHVEKKYGRDIYSVLMSTSQEVVRTSIVLEDLDRFADDLKLTVNPDMPMQGIAIQETVVMLNVHSRDIVIATDGNGGPPDKRGSSAIVLKSMHPELFDAIRAIMKNVPADSRNVRMVTTDDREIFIYKGLIGDDCYLVGWINDRK